MFAKTNNVQVAQLHDLAGGPRRCLVQFGLDNTYGLTTWTQPVPAGGGPVSLFVAGMKQSTVYHMRGVIQFADGTQFTTPTRPLQPERCQLTWCRPSPPRQRLE